MNKFQHTDAAFRVIGWEAEIVTRLEALGLLGVVGILSGLLQARSSSEDRSSQVTEAGVFAWQDFGVAGQKQSEDRGWFKATLPVAHDWFFPEPTEQPAWTSMPIETFL